MRRNSKAESWAPGRHRHHAAQKAQSFERQAPLSLARLCQSNGRHADAYVILAPALEGFSPTPEMPEIAEAQALMERLR